jgi:hypothetical protein
MKNRPQSINSGNNSHRKFSLTERKGLKSNIVPNNGRPTMGRASMESTIGTSVSKPLNRNFGSLYVPYPTSHIRYKTKNMI